MGARGSLDVRHYHALFPERFYLLRECKAKLKKQSRAGGAPGPK